MFGLGPMELMVILVIALIFVGPERIPGVATTLGKAIRSFRKATRELHDQLEIDEDIRRPLEDLRSALRDEPMRHRPVITPPPAIAPPAPPAEPLMAHTEPLVTGMGALVATAEVQVASKDPSAKEAEPAK